MIGCCAHPCAYCGSSIGPEQRWVREKIYDPALNGRCSEVNDFSILHHVSANRFHLAGHDFVLTLTTLKGREELVCLRFFQWIQKVRILPTMISSGFYPIVASSDLCWRLLRSRLTGQ